MQIPTQTRPTTKIISSHSTRGPHIYTATDESVIKDVWQDNFEVEFKKIMKIAEEYKYIGMDTEFPGIVFSMNESADLGPNETMEYTLIKNNVNQLKCIQVGLSFANEDGFVPTGICTWQFNLAFDKNVDLCAADSIELLTSSGIQFDKHAKIGIDPQTFAEYLIASGLLLDDEIIWICFHGGYDFGYLIKLITCTGLPNEQQLFFKTLNIYFPCYYDLKHLISDFEKLKYGGLSKLANDLSVKRSGIQHQAGSDSLLTLSAFFKLRDVYFKGKIDRNLSNVIYGFGNSQESSPDYYLTYVNFQDPPMMFNGYPMNITSNVVGPYYNQQENLYPNMTNSTFNYGYPNYNYPQSQFIDTNARFKPFNGKEGTRK